MLLKSVLPILGIAALQSGLMCGVGFAAARTTSISVSVTVEAGCQVSAIPSAAENAASGSKGWNAPISMNCSLPVAYQVAVDRVSQTGFVRPSSSRADLADLPAYANNQDLDLLQPQDLHIDRAGKPEYREARFVSPELLGSPAGVAHCTADGADTETVIVTIVY